MSLLYKINRVHNWNLEGTSSWLNVFRNRAEGPVVFSRDGNRNVKDVHSDGAA